MTYYTTCYDRVVTDNYEQLTGILRAFYGLLQVYYGKLRFVEAFRVSYDMFTRCCD